MKNYYLIILGLASVLLSCEKENEQTPTFASFSFHDTYYKIVNDDNNISSGEYIDIEYPNSAKRYIGKFYAIHFKMDNEDYTLKTDFILLEDSSKIYYNNQSYSYLKVQDYFDKMKSISNNFVELPDSSLIFSNGEKYINENLLSQEIEKYQEEGIIVQLLNTTNGKVYISNLQKGLNTTNVYEINKTWKEKGFNGSEERLYITCNFDLELINIDDRNEKIVIQNGTCTFWSLDN